MVGTVRIGTSGWQYRDWAGAFYPPGTPMRRWFEHYATQFPTVEINATFYRLPRVTTVEQWRARAPAGFRFAVKGSRYLTHNKKLADPEEPVATVTGRMAPLAGTHGIWLWQLPPNLGKDIPRLDRFLRLLPPVPRHAVEFRHHSWYDGETEQLLREHGVAWVWLSDGLSSDHHPITADQVYLRFHGLASDKSSRYRWDYSDDELAPWAARLRRAAEAGCDCWVYFNNDFAGHAPRNARQLAAALDGLVPTWPPRRETGQV